MPRPLELADSDSDGEGMIDLEPAPDMPLPPTTANTNTAPQITEFAGQLNASESGRASTGRASTGSTERISRDIREAERALLDGSVEGEGEGSGYHAGEGVGLGELGWDVGTGMGGRKRRVTGEVVAVSGSGSGSAGRGAKRMKTYGGGGSVSQTRDGDAVTLHSSDNLLPARGTLRADFANHEPMVMFGGESGGSTAVDGSSEQRRMVELAQSEGKGMVGTSVARLGESRGEEQRSSSSFPWTASVQTPYGKTPGGAGGEMSLLGTDVHEGDGRSPLAPSEHVEAVGVSAAEVTDARLPEENMIQPNEPTGDTANAVATTSASMSRSSPRVEISLHVETAPPPTKLAPETTTQKSTRGRKRKIQEPSSEAITSDDRQLRDDLRAAGLEKERYVPRPSRRRATQALEMPVDFSVAPEKAAKARRIKSTGGMQAASFDGTLDVASPIAELKKVAPSGSTHALASPIEVNRPDERLEEPPAKVSEPQQSPKHELATGIELDDKSAAPAVNKLSVKSQMRLMADEDDDDVFVKPMAKPKPKTKSRRSHTTIFEDHVSFGASQRTPTLSQQQAKRQNALQVMVDEGVAAANQKRRRTIVQDDEDDGEEPGQAPLESQRKHAKVVLDGEDVEDELAPAPSADKVDEPEPAVEVEEAPKKRGRGRPPKNAPSEPLLVEEVLDAPKPDPEKGVVDAEEAPKKAARRQKSTTSNAHTTESADPELAVGGKETPRISDEPNVNAGAAADPAPARAPATQEPTPSPEKVVKVIKTTSLPSKSSPTSRSPLKSSSAVPLRVGLNKRQRIAPLLRSIKPVKR
ncbi:hypothetical protein LTS02_012211 [Friedmanniomyces endolithicus]|nr:hypothetical protein LTR94_022416 [Friedmanniomyces endolithicus]KAK0788723.1 hypothetical protein LTR59_009917 [Friedmanniomyces endolithicus]KAK0817481.1 hypothetical protein LTR38_001559 [Friedmanniomyces endolithicus]KAK0837923.1 hypothetical protein LTR03_012393 [Friedmanniomyces endolithicus]KAK0852753.1 hypothetical protein LTS02_012211 [Friedmanniomyces endolithicus]